MLIKVVPENLVSLDRKSTRLNSSHSQISYAVFCLKKKKVISLSGSICTFKYASVFGNAMPSCFCTVARFARACSSVTPVLRRPIPRYHLHSLLCAIGSSTGTEDQRSTSRSGNKKDTGIMPTMEEECPLTRSFLPRAFGSALKRRRQRRSLIRTALGPPKCSSSERKMRPSAGAIPQTCKNRDAT